MTTGRPGDLVRLDEILLERFDADVRFGVERAGAHLTCRIGCTECCLAGPFEITSLDADRLRRGLASLAPADRDAIRGRALSQWRTMRHAFPGNEDTGVLDDDEEARDRFFEAFESLPCPVLDPETGACLAYAFRPLSCRSYGLPVRAGDEVLPACHLNFKTASQAQIDRATIDPDPEDLEGNILARMGEADTLIAAAIATRAS